MAEREYAVSTIKTHRGILNSLVKFMKKNHYTKLKEPVGLSFIKERTGMMMDGFWGKGNQKVNTQFRIYFIIWRMEICPILCAPK
jgi:hypothetical protein